MSRSETLTTDSLTPLRLNPIARRKDFLNLPLELRLEIYSYLLPEIDCYSSGISAPNETLQKSLRKDSEPAQPAIIRTCKQIYHETIPFLYHNRCFNFDIAGHLLRSVTNRHNEITSTHFRAWLGLSSYFKQGWSIDRADNLDWTRLEDICVTFWPVHGCPIKLRDAQLVAADLCKKLQRAFQLRNVTIVFRDTWPSPQITAVNVTCRRLTDVEYLLQTFKTLRGVQEVRVEMPAYRLIGVPCEQPVVCLLDDRTMETQFRIVESTKALMTKPVDECIVDDIAFVSNNECRFTLVNPLGLLLQILRPSTVLESIFQLPDSYLPSKFAKIQALVPQGIALLARVWAKKQAITYKPLVVVNPVRGAELEFEIVVAHYNEDLSWLRNHSKECCVYAKGPSNNHPEPPFTFTPLPNIGREGHTFLHHIVNHYHDLAEVTLFVQGRIDDHVDLSLEEMKARCMAVAIGQVQTFPFRELELFDHWEGIPWEHYPCWKRWSSMECAKMKGTPLQYFQKYISENDRVPLAVGFAPGAIFAARKETIRQHTKEYYERLLEKMFLGDMAHVNPETGHYMERFWLAMLNPEEYVQWTPSEQAGVKRNEAGQLAKGHWYRTPMGSAIDLGAARRGEVTGSPALDSGASGDTPSSPPTPLSSVGDEVDLSEKPTEG
ncbi:MAG: hypothetical protein Q9194_006092 [Teloschistes cf. exilis]